jgi:8-oxo-dGTP diphosphatase
MSQEKIIVGTVCFMVDDAQQQVLMLERGNEPMQGMWTGVGGKTHFVEGIYESCIREIFEETGLIAHKLHLRGVIKTILAEGNSSWILHIYTCSEFTGEIIRCEEGRLAWIDMSELYSLNLIGFLRDIMPEVLQGKSLIEGVIVHDSKGEVLDQKIHYFSC